MVGYQVPGMNACTLYILLALFRCCRRCRNHCAEAPVVRHRRLPRAKTQRMRWDFGTPTAPLANLKNIIQTSRVAGWYWKKNNWKIEVESKQLHLFQADRGENHKTYFAFDTLALIINPGNGPSTSLFRFRIQYADFCKLKNPALPHWNFHLCFTWQIPYLEP